MNRWSTEDYKANVKSVTAAVTEYNRCGSLNSRNLFCTVLGSGYANSVVPTDLVSVTALPSLQFSDYNNCVVCRMLAVSEVGVNGNFLYLLLVLL